MVAGVTDLLEAIKHNPLFFLDALLASLGGLLAGVAGLVLARRRVPSAVSAGMAALILGGVAVVMGGAGYWSAQKNVSAVVGARGLSESDVARLRAAGEQEAGYVLKFGVLVGLLPMALGVLVVARSRAQSLA